jgi:hypothetical protein
MTSHKSPPPDLVIRIALLRGDDDLTELSPSVWRRFRCSSQINLDAAQDKILQPLMGWTRNYHTYYFHDTASRLFYYQGKSSSADAFGMHDGYRAQDGTRVDPTNYTLGDVLTKQGDSLLYAYDLGDHWVHKLTLEQVIHKSDGNDKDAEEMALFGKCTVLGGAMCCPDEDGEGGNTYQEQVLDLLNKLSTEPSNIKNSRKYAEACYERHNALNVGGVFDAQDFTISQTQSAIQDALRTRQSERMGNKSPSMPGGRSMMDIQKVKPGQRKKRTLWQDSRGEDPRDRGRKPFFMNILEIVNVKPDDDKFAMCVCGNPCNLKCCSACHTVRYCSTECQKTDWRIHKKVCKHDKVYYLSFLGEEKGTTKVPQDEISGGRNMLKRYDPLNMRFKVNQKVECRLEKSFAKGKIVKVLHDYDGQVHAYQVKLDREVMPGYGDMIWADWDCDHMIRKVDDVAKRDWSMEQMEIVD